MTVLKHRDVSIVFSKLGRLGLFTTFQTFAFGFPGAPKSKRLNGVNVVGSSLPVPVFPWY